jgi:hypothetical protein
LGRGGYAERGDFLNVGWKMQGAGIPAGTFDDPVVPRFKPPWSSGFVEISSMVAPNGRVNAKANSQP